MLDLGYTSVTYTDEECADQTIIDANIDKTLAFQKIMTLDESNPEEIAQGSPMLKSYFTNRKMTGMIKDIA